MTWHPKEPYFLLSGAKAAEGLGDPKNTGVWGNKILQTRKDAIRVAEDGKRGVNEGSDKLHDEKRQKVQEFKSKQMVVVNHVL